MTDICEVRRDTIHYLRHFTEVTRRLNFPAVAGRTKVWAEQLRESRFNVTFMGQIRMGKSTLLNALLGEELFPAGPKPLTPTITKFVRNGEQARVVWEDSNGVLKTLLVNAHNPSPGEVRRVLENQFNAVNNQYAQKLQGLGTALNDYDAFDKAIGEPPLVTVQVEYPLAMELDGVELVDTPGTGDLVKARSDVIFDYIPRADAAVVVLRATQPLNDTEAEFIKKSLWDQGVRQLFFVLNKIDLLNSVEDQQTTAQYVQDMLTQVLGESARVYPMSAYQAHIAIQWRDDKLDWQGMDKKTKRELQIFENWQELLEESGLPEFQDALWRFSGQNERMAMQIQGALDKVGVELQGLRTTIEEAERDLHGQGNSYLVEVLKQARQELEALDQGHQRFLTRLDEAQTRIAEAASPPPKPTPEVMTAQPNQPTIERTSTMDTHNFRKKTLEFLTDFADIAREFDFPAPAERAETWSRQLRESRYNVTFMGQIKVGKSTLLNALLGEEIFPSGPIPLTPAITKFVHNGEQARVVWQDGDTGTKTLLENAHNPSSSEVYRILEDRFKALNNQHEQELQAQGFTLDNEIAIDEAAQKLPLVTVHVDYPLTEELDEIELVDTPGTGDLVKARSDVIYDYIPRADAAVVVLKATQPLNDTEAEFIKKSLWDQGVRQLFFVLNKIDLLNSVEDQQTTAQYVQDMLAQVLGKSPRVYPLSAYQALKAIQWRDDKLDWQGMDKKQIRELRVFEGWHELWEESGLTQFREELWRFLGQNERMAAQVQGARDKVGVELEKFREEVKETEKELEGYGTGNITQAIQRVKEKGKKATEAKLGLNTIKRGQIIIGEKFTDVSLGDLLRRMPALTTDPGQDEDFLKMIAYLQEVINNNSFATLKGEDPQQGLFMQEFQGQWLTYWGAKFEEVTQAIAEKEQKEREGANIIVRATLKEIALKLDRQIPVPEELEESVTVVKKPWAGKAVGTVTGAAVGFASLGWGLALAPAAGFLGEQLDESRGKKQFANLIPALIEMVVESQGKLRAEALKALKSLGEELLQQMDTKREEVNRSLQQYIAEAAEAEETVARKRAWLEQFIPTLERLEEKHKQLDGISLS